MSDGQGEARFEVSSTADRQLPYDWCRCHDAKCPQRETCLRWIERFSGDDRTTPHCDSLWETEPHSVQCPFYMQSEVR